MEGLEALWDDPAPRTPLQFLQLERRVCAAAGRQADEILGHHLIGAHQDAAFVEQAVQAARQRHDGVLRHKGQRTTSVWLPGGALCVVETPYLRPQTPRRPGRKRTRRGPTGAGVYPVLEALGIAHRVSPATRSQMALYTVQAGSYQEAVQLLAEQGVPVDVTTLRRVAQSTARADIALRDGALEQARRTPAGRRSGPPRLRRLVRLHRRDRGPAPGDAAPGHPVGGDALRGGAAAGTIRQKPAPKSFRRRGQGQLAGPGGLRDTGLQGGATD